LILGGIFSSLTALFTSFGITSAVLAASSYAGASY